MMGVGRNDRVALLINDSATVITAFMTVASGATCTTLNPNSTRSKFESLFARLNIQYLVYQAESENTLAGLEAAKACNVKLIELRLVKDAEAGLFVLNGAPGNRAMHTGWAHPEDIVLLGVSSGTTGTPKIIPRRQAGYSSRALYEAEVISIAPTDRLLNVMPLFHGAGMNHVFRSLLAGSSIVCLPEFEVFNFYQALEIYRPTWFSAVATICQAIIAQADNYESIIANHSLRFIRAGSMALPPTVMLELEQRFRVPVLEAYSSTETGNIASNRLPPFVRKPGSVGMPLELEVMIVNDTLNKVQPGQSGEIVVKGSTVFEGYENDPQANAQSFFDGWFRTGDLGYFDEDGYLFISGRIKEVINRGRQKLSPNEVESVLLEHPDIQAAAAFGVPDSQLGEEVAAAVVLRTNRMTHDTSGISVSSIQTFAAQRLVAYKVPRHIMIMDEIPLNTIGKIDRKRLAELIPPPSTISSDSGAEIEQQASSPTKIESSLVRLWAEVLQIAETRIGIQDNIYLRLAFKEESAMRLKRLIRTIVTTIVIAAVVPALSSAKAATTAIGQFYATCGDFSVNVVVSGNHDDGGGLDKFRYLITDGNGKKLYQEDATRPINTTAGSTVFNLSYDADGVIDGPPAKNPITFAVIDLDSNNNQIATLSQVTYEATCLPVSGPANRGGIYIPAGNGRGQMLTTTPFFQAPNVNQLNLNAEVGKVFISVYRTADNSWVAVYSGGGELLWVPASSIGVDLNSLPTLPMRIDGSSLIPTAASTGASPVTGITGITYLALRLHSQPSLFAPVVTIIPFHTPVGVVGRNAGGTFLKVVYNGTFGWASAFFLKLSSGTRLTLPVVQ